MDFGSSSADRDRINASACHWTCQICRFAGSITVKSISTADLSNGREGPLASRTGVPHTVPLGATVRDAFPPFPQPKTVKSHAQQAQNLVTGDWRLVAVSFLAEPYGGWHTSRGPQINNCAELKAVRRSYSVVNLSLS